MRPYARPLAWGLVCVALACAHAPSPVVQEASTALPRGVWRSRGYGRLFQVEATGVTGFHVAGPFCYRDPRPEADPEGWLGGHQRLTDDTLSVSGTPGGTRYVLERLPALPAACADRTPWTADRLAALTAETFATLYPTSAARGLDWSARAATAARRLDASSDDTALFEALSEMLADVDDAHVELHATVGGEPRELTPGEAPTLRRLARADMDERTWLRAYKRGILEDILRGTGRQVANNRLFWGRVEDVGYLNVVTMGAFDADAAPDDTTALEAALDEALGAFQGARAVIVDVSNNRGGYDGVSLRLAGRFASERRLAYTKVGFGARDVAPQAFHVEPSPRVRYEGPVYLLTSDVTVSAGEVFTLAMRALPNVRHVGTTTRGALSDQLEKPLPNGWRLALAGEVYRDAQGTDFEPRGIPPAMPLEVFPPDAPAQGHARAVLRLMTSLATAPR